MGRLAASGTPRGWERAGELTSVSRFARMFSGWGLKSLDGTAWYHPQRLTIDSSAVAAGNANPAQDVLRVRATHGDDLSKRDEDSMPSALSSAGSACWMPRGSWPGSPGFPRAT